MSGVTSLPKPYADAHGFKQLPLTLYTKSHITTTGYSKVSRGLRFPLEIPGLCTRKECSGDTRLGQWRSRYTIHAGRHSNGKAFRSNFCKSLQTDVLVCTSHLSFSKVLLLSLSRVTDHYSWRTSIAECLLPSLAGSDYLFTLVVFGV